MASRKRISFRQAALVSGLVTQEQLTETVNALIRTLRAGGVNVKVTDKQIAEALIESELITTYQGEQLLLGQTRFNLGPYVVIDWIGQGGMGNVYKGVHSIMGRESAIKVLPRDKTNDDSISNFKREIRTQATLDHPNLVRAFDAGHDGKVHYLVTEYVPGTDLRRLVRLHGPLSMQQAASYIAQSARGLEHAHTRGLIHRDVKPGNILVTPEGVAKVSDLGLAGFIDEREEDPRAGKIVGTADYLSPEQIRSPRDITSVSDIYSLGCTLYYAISGKVPFPGGTAAEKAKRHLENSPLHPRQFNPDISEEFIEIIADMMEKDPGSRVQSAGEVAARLEPWAAEGDLVPASQSSNPQWNWAPPPLPTDDMQDTDAGGYDDEISNSSGSQTSQGTLGIGNAGQDTKPVVDPQIGYPQPPPLKMQPIMQVGYGQAEMFWLVAVAIIASLCVGGMLGFLMGTMF